MKNLDKSSFSKWMNIIRISILSTALFVLSTESVKAQNNDDYCTPVYNVTCASGIEIDNVTLQGESITLDNDSGCSTDNYGDYTSLTPPDLAIGQTYTLSVASGYALPQFEEVKVWIDYDDNGSFEDDEEIGNTDGNGLPDGSRSFNFPIPDDSTPGNYRMRVMLVYYYTDFDSCSEEDSGEAEDYTVEIIQLNNCQGTPTSGTIDEDFSVCAGHAFSVNVSGASEPADGLNYIWQSSPAGEDDWADIDGSNSTTYVIENGVLEPTDFRFKVTCANSGETDISDAVTVSLNPGNECYCIPDGASDNTDDIVNFILADLDNSSTTGSSTTAPGYSDYTESVDPAELISGQSYVASLTSGPGTGGHGAAIWIDYNDDGLFSSSEKVATISSIISGGNTVPFPEFTVLDNPGMHRLRVQYTYSQDGADMDPCEITIGFSETEDYLVNVIEPSCPSPTDLSVDVTNTTINVSWTETGSATEWELAYGMPGFNPGTAGTTVSVQNNPTTLTDLAPDTTYELYVRAVCGTDNKSDFTGPEEFTTGMEPCPAPTDIVVNTEDITDSSADVNWTPSGSETQWKVIYGETGFDLDANEGTSIVVNNTPETTITNLDPDTTYDVYVVAICNPDTGNSSGIAGPVSFNTQLDVNSHLFEGFTFYPNPVNNELTLKAGNQIEQIEVYNLLGQNVMSSTPNQLQTQLNTERLQSGVYLMKVTIDGSTKTFRVVKK